MLPLARSAGRALTAVLLSTVVAWGTPVAALPAGPPVQVLAARYLTLDPTQGPPGSRVAVHGYGFTACLTRPSDDAAEPEPGEISVAWPGSDNPSVTRAKPNGEFETTVMVPSEATPRSDPYRVTALCTDNRKLRAAADFTVTSPVGPPDLGLDPTEGPVRTPVTVTGTGFEDCTADGGQGGTVTLKWDDSPLLPDPPADITADGGAFTAVVTVPPDAEAGEYTVTATCAEDEQVSAEERFEVTGAGPSPRPGVPDVQVAPASAQAGGASLTVSGSGFNCPQVEVLWDGERRDTVEPGGDGTFRTTLDVPSDAGEGAYTVRGQCAADRTVGDEAAFTVIGILPGPTTPTPSVSSATPSQNPRPDGHVPLGLIVGSCMLGAAVLAAAAYVFVTHRPRGPRWVHQHVDYRPGAAPVATDVAEPSGTGGGPPTRSVRLEPHPDPGDQTLEEDS
ncbi:hypothetical protein AB0B01_18900 [Streptomyces sp. NPDC044571]|uniref:hypothetical protein n=1 Tax=Streptomyces sp. NPDC044571 TaxID=3155371 RepID=UPI0034016BA1